MDAMTKEQQQHQKVINEKDQIINQLNEQIQQLVIEKDDMIESFQISTNILIEKIKELEAQKLGYRPQTAQIMQPTCNTFSYIYYKILTALPSNQRFNILSNRQNTRKGIAESGSWDNPLEETKQNDNKNCPICKKEMKIDELEIHTIMCSRFYFD